MRIIFLNGDWLPENEAKISVFDRGLTFAQSVYEVAPVLGGRMANWPYHAARLANSLRTAGIVDDTDWPQVLGELIARNALIEGRVYLQITGGNPGDRDFLMPDTPPPPTRIAYTQAAAVVDNPKAEEGQRIMLRPDLRWQVRHAKTTQLLYAVMMKAQAHDAGLDDAWLVDASPVDGGPVDACLSDGGHITEATSANAHIIDARGVLVSHPVDHGVLPGVTRINVIAIARAQGLTVEERAFTVEELFAAREAFATSASGLVQPVVEVEGKPIGNGRPGPISRAIRAAYVEQLRGG
jgi:D-alanine transaminase